MIQQYRSMLIHAGSCSVANSDFDERDDNDCTAIGLRRVGRFMVCESKALPRHIQRDTVALDIKIHTFIDGLQSNRATCNHSMLEACKLGSGFGA